MSRPPMDQGSKKGRRGRLVAKVKLPSGGEAPRCQAHSKATGNQCGKAARKGFRVCSSHGAGTRKRELNGQRKNPAVASVTTGMRSKPETLELAQQINPNLRELVEHYRATGAERLRDLDELLAWLKATRDVVAEQLPRTAGQWGDFPPPLLAVLNAIAVALERVAKIEGKIQERTGPTWEQLTRVLEAATDLLRARLPAEQAKEAVVELVRMTKDTYAARAEGCAA